MNPFPVQRPAFVEPIMGTAALITILPSNPGFPASPTASRSVELGLEEIASDAVEMRVVSSGENLGADIGRATRGGGAEVRLGVDRGGCLGGGGAVSR